MEHRLRLRTLLLKRSLVMGNFTLSSGVRSSYYVDCRKTTMSAEGQFLVGQVAFQALREREPTVCWVGGLTLGADPVAYAIAQRSWMEGDPIEAFTIRKQTKTHGTAQRIEGGLPSGVSVIVVEDTLTSGASALQAIEVLEDHEATVLGVLALVDRDAGGGDAIRAAGYPLITLFTAAELLQASAHPVVE